MQPTLEGVPASLIRGGAGATQVNLKLRTSSQGTPFDAVKGRYLPQMYHCGFYYVPLGVTGLKGKGDVNEAGKLGLDDSLISPGITETEVRGQTQFTKVHLHQSRFTLSFIMLYAQLCPGRGNTGCVSTLLTSNPEKVP